MTLQPTILTGQSIRLEPLRIDHTPALTIAGLYPELWRLQPAPIDSENDMRDYVQTALDDQERGVAPGPQAFHVWCRIALAVVENF